MPVLEIALSVTHVLAGAAWFGAMLYSATVLQPRATLFFGKGEDFEAFIMTLSDGARWKVLGACGLIAGSGIGLAIVRWRSPLSWAWLVLVGLKLALFLVAVALFSYTSWRLWPRRVFAIAEELPVIRTMYSLIAWSLLVLVGLTMALGAAAHML